MKKTFKQKSKKLFRKGKKAVSKVTKPIGEAVADARKTGLRGQKMKKNFRVGKISFDPDISRAI